MSEQPLDIQTVLFVMRRHRRTLAGLTLAGAVLGGALVQLRPPMYSSSAQVLLPPPAPTSTGQGRDSATDISVAMSDVVLVPAGAAMTPHMSATEVRSRVSVGGTTANVLEIQAQAPTADEAERLALDVANAEVNYQAQAGSSVTQAQQDELQQRTDTLHTQLDTVNQQIQDTKRRQRREPTTSKQWSADATALAQLTDEQAILVLQVDGLKEKVSAADSGGKAEVIEAPTPGKRTDLLTWTVVAAALGALLALCVSTIVATMLSRRDRRLRTLDEVADATGSAVIGSVGTRPPRAAAGWSALMEKYEPSVTDSWSLRQALDHVGLGHLMVRSSSGDGKTAARGCNLTLISLSEDLRGLAVGPQLASHAAALGVRTRLVVKQGHESSAALWAACSTLRRTDEVRTGLYVDTRRRRGQDDLTVEMVVVDRRHPQFVDLDRSAVTLLAVASSSATAEDLARTAVAAYEAGGRISGVIVADPDALDHTTGRLLLQQRSEQVPLPTRLTGLEQPGSTDRARGGGR